jgi:hypothetical protein
MSKVYEINAETGETTERELTASEKADAQKAAQDWAEAKALADAKEAQKAALLERLGITADEAKLLLA